MTHKKSLFTELTERRIPQILGMYVAAVWLSVEIADWMSERFDVPVQFSSYVFVILIALLPMVAMLAWAHGRPGKDKLNHQQLFFIPFNLLIAWFAVNTFIKPEVQATEIMSLVDEQTGQVIDYEVPKVGLSQKVLGFFWENETKDPALDWLSYGAMWLVSQDMLRNPIITIQTPYQSQSMLDGLRNRGYEDAIGEPLALDISIASDKEAQWVIKGKITKEGEDLTFEASLYDVVSGALVTTVRSSYDDWLFALDDVAKKMANIILDKANIKPDEIPDFVIAEHVSRNLKAIHEVIRSLNAVTFENNYENGIAHLNSALDKDESLAEAYVLLIDYYRNTGDYEAAKQAAEAALKLDYKLYQESVFKVKANYYAINGEQDKAIKVLENWVKVYPESAEALRALGLNYIVIGHRLDDALAVYEQLNQLDEAGSTVFINQAKIYRLKGDENKAVAVLQQYLELNPEKAEPYIKMADAYLQFGQFEQARNKYEEASLISTNDIQADLGLAKVMSLSGQVEASLELLDELENRAENDADKYQVLSESENILFMTGRIKAAMSESLKTRETSLSFMPPLSHTLMFGSKEVAYLAYLQEYDRAWAQLEQMKNNAKPPFDKMLGMTAVNVHLLQGNYESAAEALEEFSAFIKQHQMSVYNQFVYSSEAQLLSHEGQYEAALELFDQAINETKQSILTLNTMYVLYDFQFKKAQTLHAAGRHIEAIEMLDKVLKRNPLYAQCLVLKAKAQMSLGQLAEAKTSLDLAAAVWQRADVDFIELIEFKALNEQLLEG